jgi:hypothetical protein
VSTSDEQPPQTPWPTAAPGSPGLKVGFPGAHELALPTHRLSNRAKVALLLGGLGFLTLTLVIAALLATPGPTPTCNPLTCQGPPIGTPLPKQSILGSAEMSGTLYRNSTGFTVRYPSVVSVKTGTSGITLSYDFENGGPSSMAIVGAPTNGATAETSVSSIASQEFGDTSATYIVPGMLIGYHPGFGAAYTIQRASADGSTATYQVVLASAVQHNFVITIQIVGTQVTPPTSPTSPFWNGHASPAGTNLAYAFGDFVVNRIGFP